MSKLVIKSLIAAAVMNTTFAFASDDLPLNDAVKAEIVATLSAQGYEVGKIKIEDGLYEAYAKKDGERFEVFLDTEMKVIRIKED